MSERRGRVLGVRGTPRRAFVYGVYQLELTA